jgi:hypothetical protein
MNRPTTFTYIAAVVFALMGAAHVYRIVSPFTVTLGATEIPMWVSYVAVVVTFGLGWMLCREARGRSAA